MMYTVAAVKGIESLAMMTVSDLLFEGEAAERISDADLHAGVDAMMRIACQRRGVVTGAEQWDPQSAKRHTRRSAG